MKLKPLPTYAPAELKGRIPGELRTALVAYTAYYRETTGQPIELWSLVVQILQQFLNTAGSPVDVTGQPLELRRSNIRIHHDLGAAVDSCQRITQIVADDSHQLLAELAGLGKLGQRLQFPLVNLGDRLVDLVLQHAGLVGEHDLVPAQLEQVGAAGPGFVLVERLHEEVGGAGLERLLEVGRAQTNDRHLEPSMTSGRRR